MNEILFRDIVEARLAGDMELLNEFSLGRAYQHFQKGTDGTESLAIITAYRAANSAAENQTRQKALEGDLKSLGLGFSKLQGHWRECQDASKPYGECPSDMLKDAAEPSLFVIGIARKDAVRLQKKYEQDAIVYLGPESEGKAVLVFNDGTEQKIGTFSPQKVAQAYSKLRGGTFVFEYVAQNHLDALVEQNLRRLRGS